MPYALDQVLVLNLEATRGDHVVPATVGRVIVGIQAGNKNVELFHPICLKAKGVLPSYLENIEVER